MDIFIGNLPESFRPAELRELLIKALKKTQNPLLFWRQNQPDLHIKHYEKKRVGRPIHYFVVTLSPDDLAQRLIKRLNASPFDGVELNVREHYPRSCMNERRAPNQAQPTEGDRRQNNRRCLGQASSRETVIIGHNHHQSERGEEVDEVNDYFLANKG